VAARLTGGAGVVRSSPVPPTVSFDATLDDLVVVADALPATRARRPWLRPAVFAGLWLLLAWRAHRTDGGWPLVLALALAAPATGWLTWRLRLGTRRRALARMGRRSGALGPRTVAVAEDGLVATTRHGESRLGWAGIAARRTGRHLLVTRGDDFGVAIPLAAFGSDEACRAFEAALARGAPSPEPR
jgi:hypothetical protein